MVVSKEFSLSKLKTAVTSAYPVEFTLISAGTTGLLVYICFLKIIIEPCEYLRNSFCNTCFSCTIITYNHCHFIIK